jgi:hypothetical protein
LKNLRTTPPGATNISLLPGVTDAYLFFSQRNTTVDSSTFVARLSLDCSNLELETSSLRPQLSV